MKITRFRILGHCILPLVAAASVSTPVAAQPAGSDEGPRYTYLDLGYQWADVNYAVKQDGARHEGFKLNGSVGLTRWGDFGLHLFGEYFDGELTGAAGPCSGDRDSTGYAAGLGLNWKVRETVDLVGRAGYVNAELEVPDESCTLQDVDDDGYLLEGLVRSELSDKVEIEAGVRYSDLTDIANTDVFLGLGYHVTDYLTLRGRAMVFDDDTGFELGARFYFGRFIGRDSLF
ncbi:MAG: outer membrane beta-barrel protein [Gammaproteobacteria bacterium]|nr:outer membrane beta-barrel protein [Gammaproteobacteria bacterium]